MNGRYGRLRRAARRTRVLLLAGPLMALASAGCGSSSDGGDANAPFIDWAALRNPVIGLEDRALKDVAVAYLPSTGAFYVFASTRFESGDPRGATAVYSFFRTRDWKTFHRFADPDLNGPGYGPGSPDVGFLLGTWHMVFQAPVDMTTDARVLLHATSRDLRHWSAALPLAPALLDPALRNIDGALAEDDGYVYLGWKQTQQFMVSRSQERGLDGRWLPPRRASAGGLFAENFQFIRIDGAWRMIATGHDPGPYRCPDHPEFIAYTCYHEPFIYRMDGSGETLDDWTRWVDRTHLEIPYEDWNPVMHANAAFLADWRAYDGYFYLFYAGSLDGDRFDRRGHGKIGVARSRDLLEWQVPGE